jgi:hypothetical protein
MLGLTGTNSGDVTLAGENYLSLSGQVITANAVNLGGTNVSGILTTNKGGTGTSNAPVAGGIIYGASTSAYGSSAAGTAGQVLISGGAGAPTWVNANTFSSWTKATTLSTPAVKADNQYVTGNVGIGDFSGSTSTPLQTLDVQGRINVANGVIQRGGTAITGTNDLGLYSRVSGNWIRYVTNAAPHVWFTDDGTGTTARMQLDATGNLSVPTTLNGTGSRPVMADPNGVLKTVNRSSTSSQLFTSSGTFNVPAGVTQIYVQLVGAGGGSAYCSSNCGGGGGGGFVSGMLPVTSGEALTITVGSGGYSQSSGSGTGGGGGGGSAIYRSGTMLCAAGGGGGGSYNDKGDYGGGGGSSGFGTSINGGNSSYSSGGGGTGGNNNIDYLYNATSLAGNTDHSQQNFYNFASVNFPGLGKTAQPLGRGGRQSYNSPGTNGGVLIFY